jgi:hypothetical protein
MAGQPAEGQLSQSLQKPNTHPGFTWFGGGLGRAEGGWGRLGARLDGGVLDGAGGRR